MKFSFLRFIEKGDCQIAVIPWRTRRDLCPNWIQTGHTWASYSPVWARPSTAASRSHPQISPRRKPGYTAIRQEVTLTTDVGNARENPQCNNTVQLVYSSVLHVLSQFVLFSWSPWYETRSGAKNYGRSSYSEQEQDQEASSSNPFPGIHSVMLSSFKRHPPILPLYRPDAVILGSQISVICLIVLRMTS